MASPIPAVARSYLTVVIAAVAISAVVVEIPEAAAHCPSGCGGGEGGGEMAGPSPTAWPLEFHSLLVQNYNGRLTTIDLWYEWPKGRNFNIIRHQLGHVLYDLEWNNGTSFFFTLDGPDKGCRTVHVEVGILRPNWLDGAKYLGQRSVDGFLCNVWEKANFIWYYEDVLTRRPVHWLFYTGRAVHVMSFEVGAVLEDAQWQAPVDCFTTPAALLSVAESQFESLARAVVDGPGGTT